MATTAIIDYLDNGAIPKHKLIHVVFCVTSFVTWDLRQQALPKVVTQGFLALKPHRQQVTRAL